jgi:hypothetical protein
MSILKKVFGLFGFGNGASPSQKSSENFKKNMRVMAGLSMRRMALFLLLTTVRKKLNGTK